ncbi:MAG: hypothetical protein AB1635_15345 [Acidobacteriota bacterium]
MHRAPARSLVAVTIAAALGVAVSGCRDVEPPPAPPPLRLSWTPPPGLVVGAGPEFPFGLALAPDGRRLAIPAVQDGTSMLFLSDLTTSRTDPLPGTAGATLPFWSPDGMSVAFFAQGRLRAVDTGSGDVRDLAEAPSGRGGVWTSAGDIVFAPRVDGGLVRRAPDGTLTPLTELASDLGELGHAFPAVSAAGDLLFFVRAREAARQGIWITTLASPSTRHRLAASDASALLWSGGVLFARDQALFWQRLDRETAASRPGQPMAPPTLLGLPVGHGPQHALFATAAADVLVYGAPGNRDRQLRWHARNGAPEQTLVDGREVWQMRISPDGNRVATTEVDPQTSTLDVWIVDGRRPLPLRLSTSLAPDEHPVWSPDGTRVAWTAARTSLVVRGAQAMLPPQPLRSFDRPVQASDWSPDGRWIVATLTAPETRDDVWLVPADGGEPTPYAAGPFSETGAVVSPDGQWMVYASDESGRFELYADRFPQPSRRTRLTFGGAVEPRWRADGGEVAFRRGGALHAVTLAAEVDRLEATETTLLFEPPDEVRGYDVARDGRRFLLNLPSGSHAPLEMSVLVNWRNPG